MISRMKFTVMTVALIFVVALTMVAPRPAAANNDWAAVLLGAAAGYLVYDALSQPCHHYCAPEAYYCPPPAYYCAPEAYYCPPAAYYCAPEAYYCPPPVAYCPPPVVAYGYDGGGHRRGGGWDGDHHRHHDN
jgi:hypothetical protein